MAAGLRNSVAAASILVVSRLPFRSLLLLAGLFAWRKRVSGPSQVWDGVASYGMRSLFRVWGVQHSQTYGTCVELSDSGCVYVPRDPILLSNRHFLTSSSIYVWDRPSWTFSAAWILTISLGFDVHQ